MSRAPLTWSLLLLAALASAGLAAQDPLQQGRPGAASLISERLQGSLLSVEEAFRLQLYSSGSTGLQLHWQITPGHYLYRKSLQLVLPDGRTLEGLELPAATPIEDEYFGAVEVYYDELRLDLPLTGLSGAGGTASGSLNLEVQFQGCAEDRYCYPPHRQIISVPLRQGTSP